MPADPLPDVILLAPALDPGAPGGRDALADALEDGTFERRAREARPWETRLMAALGLRGGEAVDGTADRATGGAAGAAADGATGGIAASSVPAARLLGPDDLAGVPRTVAGDPGDAAAAGRLVVADPVSLVPGRDEATLTPPEALALSPEEAEALIGAANALLTEDGIALARGASGRWYLAGLDAAALDTPPTHFLARREAGEYLPGAGAAAPWRRLMTELQMLWHAHPVNEARLARGAAPVNGVWFWGGGPVPDAPVSGARPLVLARDPLAVALARHAGAEIVETGSLDAVLAAADAANGLAAKGVAARGAARDPAGTPGRTLLVVDTDAYAAWLADDADALERARASILGTWLAPGARSVRDGRAASLTVAGGDGSEARYAPPLRRSWLARWFGGRAGGGG